MWNAHVLTLDVMAKIALHTRNIELIAMKKRKSTADF